MYSWPYFKASFLKIRCIKGSGPARLKYCLYFLKYQCSYDIIWYSYAYEWRNINLKFFAMNLILHNTSSIQLSTINQRHRQSSTRKQCSILLCKMLLIKRSFDDTCNINQIWSLVLFALFSFPNAGKSESALTEDWLWWKKIYWPNVFLQWFPIFLKLEFQRWPLLWLELPLTACIDHIPVLPMVLCVFLPRLHQSSDILSQIDSFANSRNTCRWSIWLVV